MVQVINYPVCNLEIYLGLNVAIKCGMWLLDRSCASFESRTLVFFPQTHRHMTHICVV